MGRKNLWRIQAQGEVAIRCNRLGWREETGQKSSRGWLQADLPLFSCSGKPAERHHLCRMRSHRWASHPCQMLNNPDCILLMWRSGSSALSSSACLWGWAHALFCCLHLRSHSLGHYPSSWLLLRLLTSKSKATVSCSALFLCLWMSTTRGIEGHGCCWPFL